MVATLARSEIDVVLDVNRDPSPVIRPFVPNAAACDAYDTRG